MSMGETTYKQWLEDRIDALAGYEKAVDAAISTISDPEFSAKHYTPINFREDLSNELRHLAMQERHETIEQIRVKFAEIGAHEKK